jgi:hypothetical protein
MNKCECCREALEKLMVEDNGIIKERNQAIAILESLAEIKGKPKMFDDRWFDYEDEIVEILTRKPKMGKSGKGLGEVYKNAVLKREA